MLNRGNTALGVIRVMLGSDSLNHFSCLGIVKAAVDIRLTQVDLAVIEDIECIIRRKNELQCPFIVST